MSDIFDYIKWRGDLSLEQDGFNSLDALILSRLSYLPFEDVVPNNFNHSVKLSFAAMAFSSVENRDSILWKQDPDLLKAAACPRFANARLSGYVSSIDYDSKMQFAALVFDLNNNTRFVSFRGTDSSFIGWQEDFNMFTSLTLPSQLRALKYFEQAAQNTDARVILGGHSKGGNLALYSAMNSVSSIQKRIDGVYNFDGPGFHREILGSEQFGRVKDRVHSFVPQSSVFGMMLEHDEDFSIVKSTNKSFMQHDVYSWQVSGKDFVYLDRRTNSSYFISHTLDGFLEKLTDEEKESFTQAFFSVLEASDNTDFREIQKTPFSSSAAMLRALKNLDKSKRGALGKAIAKALSSAKENISDIISK